MKIPLLMLVQTNQSIHGIAMERFYDYYGITRQGFAMASIKLNQEVKMMDEIAQKVKHYRKKHDRRAGSRSVFYNLNFKVTYGIGVTKFERLMAKYGLTLLPLRTRVVTTKSSMQSWNYSNLCNGLVVNGINQLVVGDITYISIGKSRYYMFCLTDVFSARIVGFCISNRMRAKEAMVAFIMWVTLREISNLINCVHHTDGGGQYFSSIYLKSMNNAKLQISVAGNCLENGYAEEKNGYIKNHLIPTYEMSSKVGIEKAVQKMVHFYNCQRKQQPLGWRTPVQFEKDQIKQKNGELILHDHEQKIPSKKLGF